ncbi:uncharacterized protein LOC134258699 [Saccostrea cucullata]|uniref:uncharacterized protein LOC134258699 n=1 Tax=Saccostrea cuccullata TaxID=36930 RepID=UPI002ED07C75
MDDFKIRVMNFFRTLEACNGEQKSVFNDVLEAFNTFLEEVLLSKHITVGSSDTINVQELLYNDFLEMFRYLQPDMVEKLKIFLNRLKEAKQAHLNSLHGKISLFRTKQVDEKIVLDMKMKDQERMDFVDFLFVTTNTMQGIIQRGPDDSTLKRILEKMRTHRGTFSYQDEVLEVEEINKRNLGKMIIRHVGHEGVDEKPDLRRLLQACIDHLQTESESFWRNASITIYDEDDNMYKIASGTKKHQFICRMKNGEPFIKDKKAVSEHKKPKQSQPPSTAHGHPHKTQDKNCVIC